MVRYDYAWLMLVLLSLNLISREKIKPSERPTVSRLPEEDLLLLVSHHSELFLSLMCSNLMLLSLSSTRHCRTPYCPRKQGRFVITAYIIMSLGEKGQVPSGRIMEKSLKERLCTLTS